MRTDRSYALELDAADPLAPLRERLLPMPDDVIYLDGNSLGRPAQEVARRISEVVQEEWGRGLVRSWKKWIDLAASVGDLIGEKLLGAAGGQVLVADSTTVNLYKLAMAAVDARPGRRVIVTDDDNFPTDRYVLEGIAAQRGLELRMIPADIDAGPSLRTLRDAVDSDTALVVLSQVAYRSGALLDMAAINEIVHRPGALMLWDLCHSVGAVPIDLDATGTDLAVGCTYKYLNGGPGAPAFLYVRHGLQDELRQPIWGWFGQEDQFAMGPGYEPAPGLRKFQSGTPNILAIVAIEESVKLLGEAGIDRLREKGIRLTEYLIALADEWLPEFTVATPRDPGVRGTHVSLYHPEAWRICQALIQQASVIPDYRGPDRVRLGPAPLATRFTDVWDALDRLRNIAETKSYEGFSTARGRIT